MSAPLEPCDRCGATAMWLVKDILGVEHPRCNRCADGCCESPDLGPMSTGSDGSIIAGARRCQSCGAICMVTVDAAPPPHTDAATSAVAAELLDRLRAAGGAS